MERHAVRRPSRWSVVLCAVVAALVAVGLVAFVQRGPSGHRVAKLSAGDALLAVSKSAIFLQYDTVTGPPSTTHTLHAPVLSVQFATNRAITSGAGGVRETHDPATSEMCLTRQVDKYSTKFLKEALQGVARGAILYFTKSSQIEYLRYEMQDALISSMKFNSSGDVPTESICINFTKLIIEFRQVGQPPDSTSWDFVANAPLPTP